MTDTTRNTTVGFIGLGMMGTGMATNILQAGHALVVYDINDEKNRQLAALGAGVATGPADVARQASIVITMVDTTAQSQQVIVEPGGIIDTAQPGDVLLCMSTIDPVVVKEMHETLSARGIGMLGSPVVGMVKGATEGTLRAYVGGAEEVLERCRHVLDAMTSEIIHVGTEPNQGLLMKLINNMLYHVSSIAAIEAMVLGAKAGLDPQMIKDVIGRSTGNSAAFQYRADRIIRRDFDGVRLDISVKDMDLELSLGKSYGVPLLVPAVCRQIFEMGCSAGMNNLDATAIVQIYEQMTGIRVGSTDIQDSQ